jgi:hypothetical protein
VALDQKQRASVANSLARVLITAWSSAEYSARLGTDPRSALAEAGLEAPAGSDIVIVRTPLPDNPQGDIDLQIRLWEEGLATGRFELHIPDMPQVETTELADSDLTEVSAGIVPDPACCCSPCCCTAAP